MSICPAKAHTLVLKDEWVLKVQIGKNLYILGNDGYVAIQFAPQNKDKRVGFFPEKTHCNDLMIQ